MHAIAERKRTVRTLEPGAAAPGVPQGRWREGSLVDDLGTTHPVPWAFFATNLLGIHLAFVAAPDWAVVARLGGLLAFDVAWLLCARGGVRAIHGWTFTAWGAICAWGTLAILAAHGGSSAATSPVATFGLLVFAT